MEMTDRQLLEQIAGDLAGIKDFTDKRLERLEGDFAVMKADMTGMKEDVSGLKQITARIEAKLEGQIEPKIEVLFDGHFQNAAILDRIEKEVIKRDEFIMRRVR